MKYIINFIVISALSFMNIGNCFAEEVNWSPKDNISIYTLILSIITTIVVLLIYHWFFLPIKEIDDDGEQEYRRLHAYNQNIVNQLVKNYLNTIVR